jgi:putative transposase
MNLFTNQIIEWNSITVNDKNLTERILYISIEDNSIVTMPIFSKTGVPMYRKFDEVLEAVNAGVCRVLNNDPFSAVLLLRESDIQIKHRKRRDDSFELIKEIINLEGINQFIPEIRGKLVSKISSETGKTRQHIYNSLRRYWQYGQTKNSLLPRFHNSGKGKRIADKTKSNKKLGRPSFKSKAEEVPIGIRITPEIETLFELGIKRFYENEKRKSLPYAFQRVREDFFNDGYELKSNIPVAILLPASQTPTFRQFQYWYITNYQDTERETKKRFGEKHFNLRKRGLLGDATSIAFGPGSVYQIDATIADIYLVSSLNRKKIVGRPVIYFVIDVFSRLIVGVAVLLEGPSWFGAMLALDNVVEDKVAYCAEFGITIQPEEWSANSLPEIIMADRGEFEGYGVESLINTFGVTVQNNPPGRPDLKSVIERHFGIATEKFIRFSPGGVDKKRERGKKDSRHDSIYTLHEFESIIIAHILNYNEAHELTHYRKDEYLIADEVERFPIELWNWGIQNRSGHLRSFSRDLVRANLLPRKEVSVTAQGIHFSHQLYYTCETAQNEGWLARARDRGSWKITIAYYPRSTRHIYLISENGQKVEVCELTSASKAFLNADFYEADDFFNRERQSSESSKDRVFQSDAEFNARLEHTNKTASKQTKEALEDGEKLSKTARLKDIRGNRAAERDIEYDKNNWESDQEYEEILEQSEEPTDDESYIASPDYTDRLSEILNQQQNQINHPNNGK